MCIVDHTIELLEHPLHGAGAAAASHGDIELVVVLRHIDCRILFRCLCVDEMSGGRSRVLYGL